MGVWIGFGLSLRYRLARDLWSPRFKYGLRCNPCGNRGFDCISDLLGSGEGTKISAGDSRWRYRETSPASHGSRTLPGASNPVFPKPGMGGRGSWFGCTDRFYTGHVGLLDGGGWRCPGVCPPTITASPHCSGTNHLFDICRFYCRSGWGNNRYYDPARAILHGLGVGCYYQP